MEITKSKYKNEVYKMSLAAVFTGLGILLGAFAKFNLFGDRYIFLMGIIILIMPIVLDYKYTIISTIICVVITDLLNGWIAFSWISVLAYGLGISVIYFFNNVYKTKKELSGFVKYFFSLVIGCSIMIFIYVILTFLIWDKAMAVNELITDIIQFPLILLISIRLYKLVIKINQLVVTN